MEWFKMDATISSNPKVHGLSDGAYRALTYLWGHAMLHETDGRVPPTAVGLIPRVKGPHITELEAAGFLHRNGTGWVLHDWEIHQEDALRAHARKRADRDRKREARATSKDATS